MIHDKISNYKKYNFGSAWNKAFEFILSLDKNSKEKKYFLDSDNVYAGINCYETKEHQHGKWEAHKKYVDIQLLLSGNELVKELLRNKLHELVIRFMLDLNNLIEQKLRNSCAILKIL